MVGLGRLADRKRGLRDLHHKEVADAADTLKLGTLHATSMRQDLTWVLDRCSGSRATGKEYKFL